MAPSVSPVSSGFEEAEGTVSQIGEASCVAPGGLASALSPSFLLSMRWVLGEMLHILSTSLEWLALSTPAPFTPP